MQSYDYANDCTDSQSAPLSRRCASESVVLLLVAHGANINKSSPPWLNKYKLLHIASATGLLATVQLLVDRGACVNSRDNQGRTPLHYAARHPENRLRWSENVEVVRFLLGMGRSPRTWIDEDDNQMSSRGKQMWN